MTSNDNNGWLSEADSQFLCKLYNVRESGHIPKPRLAKTVVAQHRYIDALLSELFYANPDHKTFEGIPEEALAPMRVKRIRKICGDCKKD